jgi:GntR family transcriptional regulator of arabinose operon
MVDKNETITPPKTSLARDKILRRILRGSYSIGQRIPTEPALVEELGVSRNTIREAVASLVHDGLLERRQGSGTYVIGNEPASSRPAFTTQTVRMGMVLTSVGNVQPPSSFLLELMRGISEPIADYPKLDVQFFTPDPSYRGIGGMYYLDAIEENKVDAMVMSVAELDDRDVAQAMASSVPLIFLGLECPWPKLPFVRWDLSAGARKLVDFLCRNGWTDIGLLMDMPRGRSAAAFLSGAVAAMVVLGVEPNVSRTVYTNWDSAMIPQGVETLLRAGAKAIVCNDDDAAVRVIHCLQGKGLRVPKDIAVTGANDTLPAGGTDCPPLTTLRVPLVEIGKTVRDLVYEGARTGKIPAQNILFEPELIVRQSAPAMNGGGGQTMNQR